MVVIDELLANRDIANRIFYFLDERDLFDCALVKKSWNAAVQSSIPQRILKITSELIEDVESKGQTLEDYIIKDHISAVDVHIYGTTKKVNSQNDILNYYLFNSRIRARRLILRGRLNWDTCHCPKKGSTRGEQFDTIQSKDLTNFEYIHITSTVHVSSCALLDLVSRSPRLKILRFHGLLVKDDHTDPFTCKGFYSDLQRLYWPWYRKQHYATVTTLIKRNENIATLHANAELTCDMLAGDLLPNLRFLSLNLTEDWTCKPGHYKKISRYLEKIKYLAHAKNVEALEVRTFEFDCGSDSPDINSERIYENYLLLFWEQISKWQNLTYLALYGAWEFEKVCNEMARHALPIEFLKINLMPSNLLASLREGDRDCLVLSMADGLKYLRKLPQLRSIHLICYEKLVNIDKSTVAAIKDLKDSIWMLDIKVGFTDEVEELVTSVVRRGNQHGKVYKANIHILSKDNYANLLVEQPLKLSFCQNLRSKFRSIADAESLDRYGKASYDSIQLWGVAQAGNRDETIFAKLKSSWFHYNEKFNLTSMFI